MLSAAVLLAVLAAVVFLDTRSWIRVALDYMRTLGPWGVAVFIAVYIVAAVLFVPASALTLAAGALFGVVRGILYVWIAATLAAAAAFLIGRYLAREWVARKIEGNPAFAAIDRAMAEEGWKIVLLTRLSPAFPFALLNYAFGLTRVSLRQYVLASCLGMLPGTILYVYLGSLARAGVSQHTPMERVFYLVGLVCTIAATIVLTRKARRALRCKRKEARACHQFP